MLYDILGVPKSEYDEFVQNPHKFLVVSGNTWKHKKIIDIDNKNRFGQDSCSVKFDKYFAEKFKKNVKVDSPKNGAFANKSIYSLLEKHIGQRYVFSTDIWKYFESIRESHIETFIKNSSDLKPYEKVIKKIYFAKNSSLRRGLIASPAISEIVGLSIDRLVYRDIYSKGLEKSLSYSRYYDDLVICSNDKKILQNIEEIITKSIEDELNLDINKNKTSIKLLHGSKVLGLRFFGDGLTVPKSFKSRLRVITKDYDYMSEDDLDSVFEKMSYLGTIIASHHYIINNSSLSEKKFNSDLNYYYEELDRMKDVKQKLLEEESSSQRGFNL